MVKLTPELLEECRQFVNAVRDRELDLRGFKIPAIENLGATNNQFDTFDLSDNDLKKLDNFPLLPRLKSVILNNNRISYIQPDIGSSLPSIETLVLTNNNLQELGDLEPLKTLEKLQYLSLMGNPVTHKPQYRLYLLYKIPQIRVLDYRRVKDKERQAARQLFKGPKNAELRKELIKKTAVPEEVVQTTTNGHLPAEDVQRIREAITQAKSLQEVENLHQMLQAGQIPGKAPPPVQTNQSEEQQEEVEMEEPE